MSILKIISIFYTKLYVIHKIYFKEFSFWIYRNEKRVAMQKSTLNAKLPDTEINIVGKWNVDPSLFSFPYEPEMNAQNNIET